MTIIPPKPLLLSLLSFLKNKLKKYQKPLTFAQEMRQLVQDARNQEEQQAQIREQQRRNAIDQYRARSKDAVDAVKQLVKIQAAKGELSLVISKDYLLSLVVSVALTTPPQEQRSFVIAAIQEELENLDLKVTFAMLNPNDAFRISWKKIKPKPTDSIID